MPYTGIVFSIVGAFFGAFLILLSHWLVSAGLFPQAVQKLADVYDRRPIRAVLIGVFTYGPLQFITLNAGKIHNGPVKFIVVIAGFAALLLALVGTSGLALRIGRNLSEGADTWRQVLRGGVMLALVFITPLLGWFFALPVGLASGFGAFILARPWKSSVPTAAIVSPLPQIVTEPPTVSAHEGSPEPSLT
jgi:hypothetical protein